MNLKAIKGSYGEFGRVKRGVILRDISKDRAEKLIASGAYAVATADDLKKAEEVGKVIDSQVPSEPLRTDGPTVAEFVTAGYLASNYPPTGYASRSSNEEVAAAVAAQEARAELDKLTVDQLKELATTEEIDLGEATKKADIVSAIEAGRAAKA